MILVIKRNHNWSKINKETNSKKVQQTSKQLNECGFDEVTIKLNRTKITKKT